MPLSHADLITLLQCEVLFLECGGYRSTRFPWRPALLLEDSPNCPRVTADGRCLDQPCPWLAFVALKHHREKRPCRHIVLGKRGETIELLYRTATREEYEESFRTWLHAAIKRLEQIAA